MDGPAGLGTHSEKLCSSTASALPSCLTRLLPGRCRRDGLPRNALRVNPGPLVCCTHEHRTYQLAESRVPEMEPF